MKNLQAEHREWIEKKYPDQPPEIPAAGCVEEAGELMHAVLKLEQVRLWGEDARYKLPELRLELVDAIGDCAIYGCSLCNANGWSFELPSTYSRSSPPVLELATELVIAAALVAKSPRNQQLLVEYLEALSVVATATGVDLETAVEVTWREVRCR